ncbi:uncharacterized protein LOC128731190 [Anopheles nili]|uniref:uncharacterized protein LOC128731190 n=1 Tax=Anopheles nili TaxID=185578 RepID=UPI00237A7572|nr:uncharacterized protein LOC128731190 [Anopheles nili]
MSRNMTIPSRPAPPPPQRNTAIPMRYTPTTDWDGVSFDSMSTGTSAQMAGSSKQLPQVSAQHQNVMVKKPPPPRPPPPKLASIPITAAPLKKPGQPQSLNLFSSLFGQKRVNTGGSTSGSSAALHQKSSPIFGSIKSSPPSESSTTFVASSKTVGKLNSNCSNGRGTGIIGSPAATIRGVEMQLINFDSPPSSPTFTQKSCSDCISVESFSSDSNYSCPNNGNISQTESGFEDDFVVACESNYSSIGTPVDPFEANPQTVPMIVSGSTSTTGWAQIRAPLVNSKIQQSDFVDPLCNGQTVKLSQEPMNSFPTIIKPLLPSNNFVGSESRKSPPMPSIAPPPPPALPTSGTNFEEAYGIALYDFFSETVNDLNFKANEKIYLLGRINSEWYVGRDKRGLEGMFPANYIEVKVPLGGNDGFTNGAVARALYDFKAETPDDLTLKRYDLITVLHQISPEWLYGEINGKRGQFPANYIDHVPPHLSQV